MITVLYVDDEPDLLTLTKIFLEKSGDMKVYTASGADEAMAVLASEPIDVIISDYQMPEKDGIWFLKKIRSLSDGRPFILFTGRGREEIVIEAINSGADFYLQKGGDPRSQYAELVQKIRQGFARWNAELSLRQKHEELNAAYEQLAASEEELRSNFEELTENRSALWESERRLTDIINFLPDATFAIDRDGVIIAWNHAIEEMTGCKTDVMVGKGGYMHALPFYNEKRPILIDLIFADIKEVQEGYYNITRKGDMLSAETKLPKIHGEPMIAWCKASPLYNEKGELTGAIESIRDVSEERRIQKELQESEEKYRSVLDNIQEAYYRTDSDGNLILASPSFLKLFGYQSFDEVLGRSVAQTFYYYPEMRKEFLNLISETGFVENYELISRSKNGLPIPIATSSHYYYDTTGSIAGIEGIFRDITEQKRYEDELREKEERLEAIINNSPFGVHLYSLEPDDRLVFRGANKAADVILGVENSLYVGRTIEEAFPPLAETHIPALYREVARSGGTKTEEQIAYSDEGGISGAFELHLFQTSPGRMASFFIDVTARKKAEESLRRSIDKYQHILNVMKEGLIITDETGVIVFWSHAMETLTGISGDYALQKNIWVLQQECFSQEENQTSDCSIQDITRSILSDGEVPEHLEGMRFRLALQDGTLKTIETTIMSVRTEKGFIICESFQEITDPGCTKRAPSIHQSPLS